MRSRQVGQYDFVKATTGLLSINAVAASQVSAERNRDLTRS